MAQKKVYKARTAIADKNGELISAGETVTPDQFENDVFNRLMSPELKAIVKDEADDDGNSNDVAASDREAMFKALNRKNLDGLNKHVEGMRSEGWKVEYAEGATKEAIIDAILDAKKGE